MPKHIVNELAAIFVLDAYNSSQSASDIQQITCLFEQLVLSKFNFPRFKDTNCGYGALEFDASNPCTRRSVRLAVNCQWDSPGTFFKLYVDEHNQTSVSALTFSSLIEELNKLFDTPVLSENYCSMDFFHQALYDYIWHCYEYPLKKSFLAMLNITDASLSELERTQYTEEMIHLDLKGTFNGHSFVWEGLWSNSHIWSRNLNVEDTLTHLSKFLSESERAQYDFIIDRYSDDFSLEFEMLRLALICYKNSEEHQIRSIFEPSYLKELTEMEDKANEQTFLLKTYFKENLPF